MEQEQIAALLLEAAVEIDGKKKMSCARAFAISKEHGLSLQEIGKGCDDNKIKVMSCQLGCFE